MPRCKEHIQPKPKSKNVKESHKACYEWIWLMHILAIYVLKSKWNKIKGFSARHKNLLVEISYVVNYKASFTKSDFLVDT